MAYTLTVHHGKEKHKLELAAGSSVGDVKVALFAVAGVAAADQRLLHKGKECGGDEARLLADLKVKPKDKMLLLLSQAAGERAASTAAAAKLTASRAAAKDAQLREDEPHPVAAFRACPQLRQCLIEDRRLGGHEARKIIRVVSRRH